jgi:hypothetical protein
VSTETIITVTQEEFDLVAADLRWSKNKLDAARDLLVAGRTLQQVAGDHDLSPEEGRILSSRFVKRLQVRRARNSPEAHFVYRTTMGLVQPALTCSGISAKQLFRLRNVTISIGGKVFDETSS